MPAGEEMEPATTFLHGPSYTELRRAAIARAEETAGDGPGSVLWLERNEHLGESIADVWAADNASFRLWISSLDDAVNTCYDRLTGPRERVGALVRRQIVDHALRQLDEAGVLADAHRYRDEVMSLFSSLEGEGYDTSDALEDLVSESSLPPRTHTVLVDAYRRYRECLSETTTSEEYAGFEAYQGVQGADLADLLSSVDVVVLSGYYQLTRNEKRFVEQLAASFELIITLPEVSTASDTTGANVAAADARSFYQDLASETTRVEEDVADPLSTIASHLYTPEPLDQSIETGDRLRWVESQTPDREVRHVAKSIKHRVATEDGFTQDNALVVVPGLISYREHVEDVFESHRLTPVTYVNKLLYQTNSGRAMLDLVSLCTDGSGSVDEITSLATNPAVSIGIDGTQLSETARALPHDDLDDLQSELDDRATTALDSLMEEVKAVADATGTNTIDNLRDLFASVGLNSDARTFDESMAFDAVMEQRAIRRVERALDAIERVAKATGTHDTLTVVSDELDQIRVPPPRQSADGVLEVSGPREAFGQSYDHLYLVGMTDADFPPSPERPVFFEEIWDNLEGIDATDHTAVARYQFTTMLASAQSVYISTPRTTIDDDPLLESSLLDELRRVTGIEPTSDDLGHGDREDVQRAVGHITSLGADEAVESIIESGVFDGELAERARSGVECAQHRASRVRTEHDGILDPATVESLYPATEREPYSPSQLKDYARCGFRFLMERVFDVDEPPEYKLEPDALDFGSVAHDTLEYFYTGLQSEPGEPVDLSSWGRDELEERLLAAGERALDEADLPYDDAFHQRWLESLFAGLCDPERNSYFGARDEDVHLPEEGLFATLLTEERERGADESPGWFEVQLDLSDAEDRFIELDVGDNRTIPLGGRIDRVTIDWSDDPPTGIVHDYKTGGGDLREAVDGVTFQLPIYALSAGRQLDDEGVSTPFDAGFYTLDHDSFGEGWSLHYYIYREGEHEDADERYRQLVEEKTPQRIGDIVEGIEDGAFQPTVLDEDTAGCRHCEFSDVCDVRYHMRRDIIAEMDEDDRAGYVPQYARADSFLDATESDAE